MLYRKDLERKASEIKAVSGVDINVLTDNGKLHLIYDDKSFSGSLGDCYSFLDGYLAAVSCPERQVLQHAG